MGPGEPPPIRLLSMCCWGLRWHIASSYRPQDPLLRFDPSVTCFKSHTIKSVRLSDPQTPHLQICASHRHEDWVATAC